MLLSKVWGVKTVYFQTKKNHTKSNSKLGIRNDITLSN